MTNEKMARLRKLCNKFEVKDMPFSEFVLAFDGIMKPISQQEILDLQMEKAREESSRIYRPKQSLFLLN